MAHIDMQAINVLAREYKNEPDSVRAETLRQSLWAQTYELLSVIPLKLSTVTREDAIQQLSLRLPAWIELYNPTDYKSSSYVGYISKQAQDAAKNIFRDSSGIPRRVFEARMQFVALLTQGEERDEAVRKVCMGQTAEMTEKILTAINTDLRTDSLDREVKGNSSSTKPLGTLGDTIGEEAPQLQVIERETRSRVLLGLHERHRRVVEQVLGQGVSGLHDIDFGAPTTLLQKVTLFSEAASRLERLTSA